MRATIIVPDDVVLVDGIAQRVDCSELLADGVHAVQWYDTRGEKEFVTTFDEAKMLHGREPNELFDDFTPYQKYVDQWEIAYQASQAARAELEKQAKESASPEGQAKRKAQFEDDMRQFILKVLKEEKLIK